MKIFVTSPGSERDITEVIQQGHGVLISANAPVGRWYMKEVPVALDNGAYPAFREARGFDEYGFLRTLHQCLKAGIAPEFVVCPDIVAAGKESLAFSLAWQRRLAGHPLYLAVQDGMEPADIAPHIRTFEGLFVGGSMPWKLRSAAGWISFAREHGKKCHIGRIGTIGRLIWAESIGADSVDSSSFTRNGTLHYCQQYRAVMQACPRLFE